MARWTKKLIEQQLTWTNDCFRLALIEVFGHILTNEQKSLNTRELKLELIGLWRAKYDPKRGWVWPEEVNQAYLKYLRLLPTEQIELIIEAYNKDKFSRSPLIIEVLTSELLERVMNSETRNKHG